MNIRKAIDKSFYLLSRFSCWLCVSLLFILIVPIVIKGFHYLDWDFLTSFPSRFATRAGVLSALAGTFWVMVLTALFAVPIGILTAIYLSEYADKSSKRTELLRINISNLAGMPSIVYGLLGLAVFVRFFSLERSLISGSLTLALLVLPIIIIASESAIKAVPDTIRSAAYALGARKWQVVFGQVLPAAMPGVLTGIILAMSRAIGETAPLILVGALSFVAFTPDSLSSPFTVLPVQVFNWTSRPQENFQDLAASAIVVLLFLLILLNGTAIWLRNKYQRYKI